jgi:hypothetical protein
MITCVNAKGNDERSGAASSADGSSAGPRRRALSSLPLTFAGGLAIGVLASLSTKWFTTGLLASVPAAVPFIVLFVALLVFPRRYLVESSKIVPRLTATWAPPPALSVAVAASPCSCCWRSSPHSRASISGPGPPRWGR